jgi:hypothetical protein
MLVQNINSSKRLAAFRSVFQQSLADVEALVVVHRLLMPIQMLSYPKRLTTRVAVFHLVLADEWFLLVVHRLLMSV